MTGGRTEGNFAMLVGKPSVSRRRFISITAVAGVCLAAGARPLQAQLAHTWQGSAMGSQASIRLYHADKAEAEDILSRCAAEIERLERIFSLYRADSDLVRLNRDGEFLGPSTDMVALLAESVNFARVTEGAFDPTVQPVFRAYADHFGKDNASPQGPVRSVIDHALARVGWQGVRIDNGGISFARPGMEVTLNGIAQGYFTDRITELLSGAGLQNVLVNLGEIRALGAHPDGQPWTVGIPSSNGRPLSLRNEAIATSAPSGTIFNADGRFHHLLDPRSGGCASRWRSVTVMAQNATVADALSTAFSVMDQQTIASVMTEFPGTRVFARGEAGAISLA